MKNRFCLKSFRKSTGMSQTELAHILDSSRSTIGNWELRTAPAWVELACRGVRAAQVFPHIILPLCGPSLAAARSQLGLNQEELADELAVTRSSISRWENGSPPRWVAFAILTLAFKV